MAVRTKRRTELAGAAEPGDPEPEESEGMISLDIRDYMATELVTLDPEADLLAAANMLIDHDISGAPVVDGDGRMIGILTERDCLQAALQAEYYGTRGGLVRDFMSVDVESVAPNESILKIAAMFIKGSYNRYPVVEDGRLVGQISRLDVMRALRRRYQSNVR
jgi:CBS domain-containing protein